MFMLSWIRDKLQRGSSVGLQNRQSGRSLEGMRNNPSGSRMHSEHTKNEDLTNKTTLFVSFEGETWFVSVGGEKVLQDLLQMALDHFLNPAEAYNLLPKYKFLRSSSMKVLNMYLTVKDEDLQNGDEIILVESATTGCVDKKKLPLKPEDFKGPTKEEIVAATAHIPKKISERKAPFLECQDNFQTEIEKVLYSLVEASAKILCHSSEAKLLFDDIAARINAKTKKEIDKDAVKKIKELGFTEGQARYALRLKRNRPVEALEWLLENSHRVKEDMDETESVSADVASTSTAGTAAADHDPLQTINKLLQDIHNFHQRHFEPSSKALKILQDMGFSQDEAVEALRLTGNNPTAASEWLCGERDYKSLPKLDVSLDTDGPLYKALMDNPAIQMGLNNPKVLLAFLSILENPSSASMWLTDVDTSPVLAQVFKTYHSEKHIMVMNQQSELMHRT